LLLEAGGGEDLGAYRFPRRFGIKQQAAVRMGGQYQAAFAGLGQGIAMTGRNRHPPFRIETERCRTLKHPIPHFFPLLPTLRKFFWGVKKKLPDFSGATRT
jgi:hypothetical protein